MLEWGGGIAPEAEEDFVELETDHFGIQEVSVGKELVRSLVVFSRY